MSIEAYEFQQEKIDYRFGLVSSVIANVNRSKGTKPFKPADFMPRKKKKAQSVDEMYNMLKAVTLMSGGEVSVNRESAS